MIINSNPAKYLAAWAHRNAKAAYREIQEKTMTNAIEVTKREMYAKWNKAMEWVSPHSSESCHLDEFEELLEAHLEALRQDRAALTTERDTLRNRVQVLEMANATSGEVIRGLKDEATQALRARMRARIEEFVVSASDQSKNVASTTLDANTATILGALVDAQRIMTDYLVPDGIRAKDAMGKIIPVLDNEKLCLAMDAFERPTCMHSFHPVPMHRNDKSEMCTFCGVGK